jgi:hypothetical protein
MSKVKVLDVKYGIAITKPWSQEMYKHNDTVASEMKENIFQALNKAYEDDNETALREIGKSVCAYGFGQGFDIDEMHSEICRELDIVQNYWLNDEYPYLVSKGYVENVKMNFVGYDK